MFDSEPRNVVDVTIVLGISNLTFDKVFSLEEPLIALVIPRVALYCTDSSFWGKELL